MKLESRQNILLVLFLGLIALSLLAPIASDTFFPESMDYAVHTAGIIQAKMGWDEGQFPLRTAIWQDQGMGNAFFTYYSPFSYMFAGGIYKLLYPIIHVNPYFIFKLTLWLSLLAGGIYFYRLTRWLLQSSAIALLSSLVYMAAPYYLINLNTRGDFTEAFAQGLVPIVLFYTFRSYKNGFQLRTFLFAVLSWSALITSHLITCVYTSCFVGLFLLLSTLQNRSQLKSFILFISIYCSALILTLWYLIPIALTTSALSVVSQLHSPAEAAWLTPLSSLLSINAVSPMPLPGNGLLPLPLYPAVGWPILISVILLSYLIGMKKLRYLRVSLKTIVTLLALFAFAFFLTWSPFDFWRYLPKVFTIAQFPYRLLTQCMWIGALLFGFALLEITRGKCDISKTTFIAVFIVIAGSSWLQTNRSSTQTVNDIRHAPSLGYAQHAYLVQTDNPNALITAGTNLPVFDSNGWLTLNHPITISTQIFKDAPHASLKLKGEIPTYLLQHPVKLSLKINGKSLYEKELAPGPIALDIPLHNFISTDGESFTLEFSVDKPAIPSQMLPSSNDNRPLAIKIDSLQIDHLTSDFTALSYEQVKPLCQRHHGELLCHIDVKANTGLVQVPQLYYPQLLKIEVNGQPTSYLPIVAGEYVMAGLKLAPGSYDINVKFKGISWANCFSLGAWLLVIFGLIFPIFKRILRFNPLKKWIPVSES